MCYWIQKYILYRHLVEFDNNEPCALHQFHIFVRHSKMWLGIQIVQCAFTSEYTGRSWLLSTTHTHFPNAFWIAISGSYMYTEADSTSIGQSARLRSALYSPATSDSCLTFWYHMHGEQIGIINVLTASGSAESLAWTRAGTQGDQWLVARVPVTGTTPFNVSTISRIHICDLKMPIISVLLFSLHIERRN